MNEDQTFDRRKEMLAKFRDTIHLPMSERFFSEDDLIEIFDYAGDMEDDYVRLEVLMCAARFYPDSEELKERKAIFYSQYSDAMLNDCLNDNRETPGMIWDVMRARGKHNVSSEMKKEILDEILAKYDNFTDEEIIQFVGLASSFGEVSWLKENMPQLREKSGYINMLLYEVAVAADVNNDPEYSIEMLEELTEIEPFNSYYWSMLAGEYAICDDRDKALSAIDYSLAINPDGAQALFIKARLLYEPGKDIAPVVKLLAQAMASEPSAEIARYMASLFHENGKADMGQAVLEKHYREHPEDMVNIVPDLLLYRPANIEQLIEDFYYGNPENSQIIWISWAQQLSLNGYPDVAKVILDTYERLSGNTIDTMFPIEDMFQAKKFDEVISAIGHYLEHTDLRLSQMPGTAVMNAISLAKLGEYDKASEFCRMVITSASVNAFLTLSGRMEYLGMMKIVKDIYQHLQETTDREFWDTYDPLGIWTDK